jgi:hypothetical protein
MGVRRTRIDREKMEEMIILRKKQSVCNISSESATTSAASTKFRNTYRCEMAISWFFDHGERC